MKLHCLLDYLCPWMASSAAMRREAMAKLDAKLDRHVAEARKVENSADIRALMAQTDPSREEMRQLAKRRLDAIDSVFRGRTTE